RKNQRLKAPRARSTTAAAPESHGAHAPAPPRTPKAIRTTSPAPAPRNPPMNGSPSRAIFIRSVDPSGRPLPGDRLHAVLEQELLLLEDDFFDLLLLGEEEAGAQLAEALLAAAVLLGKPAEFLALAADVNVGHLPIGHRSLLQRGALKL